MNFRLCIALAAVLALSPALAQDTVELKTLSQRHSYAYGSLFGEQMTKRFSDLELELFIRGIRDAAGDGKPLMNRQEALGVIQEYKQKANKERQAVAAVAGTKNIEEGKAFLAANGKKDGVITLPSGLQYKVLTAGTGAQPSASDTVETHYRGTLLDGTEFDSSHSRGKPAAFQVNRVVKGWQEALQLMKVGGKWQLFIPSDLAYGERGAAGGKIGPNAALIFEIELLSIK